MARSVPLEGFKARLSFNVDSLPYRAAAHDLTKMGYLSV